MLDSRVGKEWLQSQQEQGEKSSKRARKERIRIEKNRKIKQRTRK
jgi:hypothetical protein